MTKVDVARRVSAFLLVLGAGSADAAVLYGATGGNTPSNLYTIDPATGAATPIGPIGFAVTGLAFDPTSGILYGVTSNASSVSPHSLITVDPATGAGTLIGDEALGSFGIADITFDDNGTLFGWSEGSDDLATVNVATGQATVVGNSGISTYGSGIQDIDGVLFYAGDGNDGAFRRVDKASGLPITISTLTGSPGNPGDAINALAADQNNTLFGVVNSFGSGPTFLVTIDPASGQVTTIGPSVNKLDAIAFSVGVVNLDYGDAPSTFPTSLAQNGARHRPGGPFLGTVPPDVEGDGQANGTATGDDNSGSSDEDGVVVLMDSTGAFALAQVTVSNAPGLLDAWIDFNQDGSWDPTEQIFASRAVPIGTTNLTFTAPISTYVTPLAARFRISTAGGLQPTGFAPNGEVEDYLVQPLTVGDDHNNGEPPPVPGGGAFPLLTLAGLLATALWRRRRG